MSQIKDLWGRALIEGHPYGPISQPAREAGPVLTCLGVSLLHRLLTQQIPPSLKGVSGRCSQRTVIAWHSDPEIGSSWWQSPEPSEFAGLARYVEPGLLGESPKRQCTYACVISNLFQGAWCSPINSHWSSQDASQLILLLSANESRKQEPLCFLPKVSGVQVDALKADGGTGAFCLCLCFCQKLHAQGASQDWKRR